MKRQAARSDERTRSINRDWFPVIGREATLINREVTGYTDDGYNDPIRNAELLEIHVELLRPNQPGFERRAAGTNVTADALILLSDQHDVYTGGESDTHSPSHVVIDGTTYEVFDRFDEGNGIVVLHTEVV